LRLAKKILKCNPKEIAEVYRLERRVVAMNLEADAFFYQAPRREPFVAFVMREHVPQRRVFLGGEATGHHDSKRVFSCLGGPFSAWPCFPQPLSSVAFEGRSDALHGGGTYPCNYSIHSPYEALANHQVLLSVYLPCNLHLVYGLLFPGLWVGDASAARHGN
jgi:hypothetical protein